MNTKQAGNGTIGVGASALTICGRGLICALVFGRMLLYGADGDVVSAFNPNVDDVVYAMGMQPDETILIGGQFTVVGGTPRYSIARLNGDGSPEGSFSASVNGSIRSLAVQVDGKVLIGGPLLNVGGTTRNRIARLNADGSLDGSYDPNAGGTGVYNIAVMPDGKTLFGGDFPTIAGALRLGVAKVNGDGTLDTTFGNARADGVFGLVELPDGKILIGGGFQSVGGNSARRHFARLNADGSLDSGFSLVVNNVVYCLAIQPDGKILIGGNQTYVGGISRNRIARLNTDGSVDSSFNPNANGTVYGMALQSDGRILVAGSFTTIGGTTRNRIARLNADGSLDGSFNPNANNVVFGALLRSDGKILIGGGFTNVGGVTRNRVALLDNAAGSQSISVLDSTVVQWLRSGTAAEVEQVTFELSTDGGTTWLGLGRGGRVSGGWQLAGQNLPINGRIRARGRATGGAYNGSSGVIEQVTSYALPDTVDPTVQCPPDVTVNTEPGENYARGVALGTPIASDNSGSVTVTNDAPAQIPAGTNTVTWTAFDASGNSSQCQQKVIVNRPPVCVTDSAGTALAQTLTIPALKLAANDSDPDGDPLTVTAVTSPSALGAIVSLASGMVSYHAPVSGTSDSFTYTVNDGRGGTALGTVNVTLYGGTALGFNQLAPDLLPGGELKLNFLGIPELRYALELTHELSPPDWVAIQTNRVAPNGWLFFTNRPSVPGPDFYRTRHVP